jgi:hypothetical protein
LLVAVASLFVLALPIQAFAERVDQPGNTGGVDDRTDKVIAVGSADRNGNCVFENLEAEITPTGDGATTWAAYAVRSDCVFVRDALWTGARTDGVLSVAPQSLLVDSVSPFSEEVFASDNSDSGTVEVERSTAASGGVGDSYYLASTSCGTNEQLVYTYGGGGPVLDKLTQIKLRVDWCRQTSPASAWITGYVGTCIALDQPPSFGYDWIIDSCSAPNKNLGPVNGLAYVAGQGSFHCGPTNVFPCNLSNPNGYYHTLYNTVGKAANGSSHCSYSYTGQKVFGPNRSILQGCT